MQQSWADDLLLFLKTTEIGIATLAQIAAQSSVESHQSISPEKISKTNKTDLQ